MSKVKDEIEVEVFRIIPEVGNKCYEYAESTRSEGVWPNNRRFTTNKLLYVGRLIKIVTGGYGDNGWRIDYFQDNSGKEQIVRYSYEGNTCFREVPCRLNIIPSLQSLSKNIINLHCDYSSLPEDDPYRVIIENFESKESESKV